MRKRKITVATGVLLMASLALQVGADATSGDTEYLCFGRTPTLVGSDSADVLVGGPETDVIIGLGGHDTIIGGGGRDFLCGGRGADSIHGGLGGDRIDGEEGHDSLFGDGGNDVLRGGRGDDIIEGGKKHDVARGGGGFDQCRAETTRRCEEPRLGLEFAAGGFVSPVFVGSRPGDPRLFIVDQPGTIWALAGPEPEPVLEIGDLVRFGYEEGLLGLAFHPSSPERMFVNYSEKSTGASIVAEFRFPIDAAAADPNPVRVLLRVDQPSPYHNGGMLAFGPDGYLYSGFGDGGTVGDPFANGQDTATLLGSIVRIDVDSASPYAIPPDNPFLGHPEAAPEIWAIGVRNPWRFSFDGDLLIIADVGQHRWEEITVLDPDSAGANLGWPITEGPDCYASPNCDRNGLVEPTYSYDHSEGRCAITGGYVYRGSAIPGLQETYVFGDFCTGRLMGVRIADGVVTHEASFDVAAPFLKSFGVDPEGELYITAGQNVYKLVHDEG